MSFNLQLVSLLVSLVAALPNGSPVCYVNEAQIQASAMLKSDPTLGYSLAVQYGGSNTWDISIKNKAGRPSYEGILLYVHQTNAPQKHLGQITFQDQTKWKYMDTKLCSGQGVNSSTPQSTITQSNEKEVLFAQSNPVFKWTSTPQELALPSLVVHAAIATNNNGATKWQHLTFYGLAPIPMANGTAAVASSSNSNSTILPPTPTTNTTMSTTSSAMAMSDTATSTVNTTGAANSTTTHANSAFVMGSSAFQVTALASMAFLLF